MIVLGVTLLPVPPATNEMVLESTVVLILPIPIANRCCAVTPFQLIPISANRLLLTSMMSASISI